MQSLVELVAVQSKFEFVSVQSKVQTDFQGFYQGNRGFPVLRVLIQCTECSVQSAVYSVQCVMCSVQCVVYSV